MRPTAPRPFLQNLGRAASQRYNGFVSRTPPWLRMYQRIPGSKDPNAVQRTTFGTLLLYSQIPLYAHLFFTHLYTLTPCSGISMVPTIPHTADRNQPSPWILTSKLYSRGRHIAVGDVIEFKHPLLSHTHGAKRVIGLPGDFVAVITPGKVDIDDDSEKVAQVRGEVIRVPEGHVWVEGDNLEWSRDSRMFGPVPLNLVQGKVLAIVWPWGKRGWLKNTLVPAEGTDHETVFTM